MCAEGKVIPGLGEAARNVEIRKVWGSTLAPKFPRLEKNILILQNLSKTEIHTLSLSLPLSFHHGFLLCLSEPSVASCQGSYQDRQRLPLHAAYPQLATALLYPHPPE